MPIYQYKCKECNHEWEQLLKVGENPDNCPKCETVNFSKVIQATPIIFKGKWFCKGGEY